MLYLHAFQKCSYRERLVEPFSSVGSRIIASEDTQDLISSRNYLEVEYACRVDGIFAELSCQCLTAFC